MMASLFLFLLLMHTLFGVRHSVTEEVAVLSAGFWGDMEQSFAANILAEQRWRLILDGLKATLLISAGATLAGTVIGMLVCALHMARLPLLSFIGRAYIYVVRGLPVLLLLMLIFYVVFASVNISPVGVAIIAFAINFGAYAAVMFRNGIESVPPGQTEAGLALGFTRVQTFRQIIVPQALRRIVPVYRSEFITLVKTTSIVGYIGVQDLTRAGDIIRSRTFEAFFPLMLVAVLYFVIIWFLGLGLDHFESRMEPRRTESGEGVVQA
ncbi:MAG: amino acid ABC transporter permease [Desulfuromonadaceae bacterium]